MTSQATSEAKRSSSDERYGRVLLYLVGLAERAERAERNWGGKLGRCHHAQGARVLLIFKVTLEGT